MQKLKTLSRTCLTIVVDDCDQKHISVIPKMQTHAHAHLPIYKSLKTDVKKSVYPSFTDNIHVELKIFPEQFYIIKIR